MKGNKGITLIALVITIIVLLILAGVSIAMLSGKNSILGRASESSVKTSVSSAKEQVGNLINEAITEYYNEVYVNGNNTASAGEAPIQTYVWSYLTDSNRIGPNENKTIYENVTVTPDATNHKITIAYSGDTTKKTVGTIDTNGKIKWENETY